MKLIDSKVEYIPQEEGREGVLKHVEKCGRIAFKSEDKITEDSYKAFLHMLCKMMHFSVLEHGTVYLKVPVSNEVMIECYQEHPYSKVNIVDGFAYITMNYKTFYSTLNVLAEEYIVEPTEYHHKRYTFKFTCSRAMADELRTHRLMSHTMESLRYCNYSKDKYDNEITFVRPLWAKLNTGKYIFNKDQWRIEGDGYLVSLDEEEINPEDLLILNLMDAQTCYMDLLEAGLKPQEARFVLPMATKTELVVTGFAEDWRHIVNVRLYEITGKVDPNMKDLMEKFRKVTRDNNIWESIMDDIKD